MADNVVSKMYEFVVGHGIDELVLPSDTYSHQNEISKLVYYYWANDKRFRGSFNLRTGVMFWVGELPAAWKPVLVVRM